MAEAFAKEGYATIICARTKADVEKAASEISASGLSCEGIALDVTNSAAVQSAIDSIVKTRGKIDVLVCCAGIYGPIGPIEGNDPAHWQMALMVNLVGTMLVVRACVPSMKKAGKGCIITMAGGGVGGKKLKPNFSSYVTSKFGVCGFTEAVAAELEGTGVRINAISPGAVNTRLLEEVLSSGEKAGKDFLASSRKQKENGGTPPQKACSLALYLAGDGAKSVNGKMLSAVWDDTSALTAMGNKIPGALYTLKRIDNQLFSEKA